MSLFIFFWICFFATGVCVAWLPTRRRASAILAIGQCLSVCVSVCVSLLCVCHTPVLYRNDSVVFCVQMCRFPSTYATLYVMKIRLPAKIRVIFSGTFSQTLYLEYLAQHFHRRRARYNQATAVGLLLTTPGDVDGRDKCDQLWSDNRRLLIIHGVQLCVGLQRDCRLGVSQRRAAPSASADFVLLCRLSFFSNKPSDW